MHSTLTLLLLLALLPFSEVNGAKILFFHTGATPSHRSSIFPVAARLADAGHNVTYVFPLSRRIGSHPGVEEFVAKKFVALNDAYAHSCEINYRLNNTLNEWMYEYFEKVPQFCAEFYNSPETEELLTRRGKFDLILIDGIFGQCAYGMVHHFQAKHILFNTVTYPFLWESFGLVPESSSNPDWMFSPKARDLQSSVWSRLVNGVVVPILWRNIFTHIMQKTEAVVRKTRYLREIEQMPSFAEIEQETSLVLHNTYFIEDYPMSLPPMFVSYSGLLCSKTERLNKLPLPENLERFLHDTDGFVYISFGSAVSVNTLPEMLLDQFRVTLEAFPNLKFFWKWDGPLPENMPKNVLFQRWFPQINILAHSKIKAFMTQAGRPSTQEALCYGVPMIAFPMFADQVLNAGRLDDLGMGIHLELDTLNSVTLINAIQQITETNKFKSRALELSTMFRDRPMDPLDSVHYWIEYVLGHNNTDLLKPLSLKQPWWQRRLLDVYALLLFIILIIFSLFILVGYGLVKIVARCLAPTKSVTTSNLKKKKTN